MAVIWKIVGPSYEGDGHPGVLIQRDWVSIFVEGGRDEGEPSAETWRAAIDIHTALVRYPTLEKENQALLLECERAKTDARMLRVAIEQERARRAEVKA